MKKYLIFFKNLWLKKKQNPNYDDDDDDGGGVRDDVYARACELVHVSSRLCRPTQAPCPVILFRHPFVAANETVPAMFAQCGKVAYWLPHAATRLCLCLPPDGGCSINKTWLWSVIFKLRSHYVMKFPFYSYNQMKDLSNFMWFYMVFIFPARTYISVRDACDFFFLGNI